MKNRAVFLDRDGTVNRHIPYLKEVSDFELLPNVAESIALLNKNSFKVVIVTNQSGIGRGYFDYKDLKKVNEKMRIDLNSFDSWIDGLYQCTHTPDDNCICRKPKNGMIKQACNDLKLDLHTSFLVGDRKSDITAGATAGCKTILVLTGYGEKESATINQWLYKPDFVAKDLFEATTWILNNKILEKI